ncbi:unnamed protein product [Polarella glacialis]|uniref:Uncharacterized protein n=1 Tax=Polarella glacialis TaxID=89957 RepID=A0A813K0Y5_POLGL|nr:unnamed protein product [Polarella glacialis]|eukprot:CAMPEP_0115113526 /NCGR_PEP_ID=MMETSP0227-20121206/41436_1 /TAXON_ID=89957 /ORGANISM="Polarella glacialis, Strain CCMP 1383" /LENGTH=124 /DNA_ID=CAMNT_0002513597 /DNA_START=155 /DNA_END=529 /DNA_ORIENTATION=+
MTAQLAGQRPSSEGGVELERLQEAVLSLRERELESKVLLAFGEASPTSLRTSWEVRLAPDERDVFDSLPLTQLRRQGGEEAEGEGVEGSKPYKPPSWEDERLSVVALLVGMPLLFSLLLWISSP